MNQAPVVSQPVMAVARPDSKGGVAIALALLVVLTGFGFYRGARFDLLGNTLVYYVITYGDGLIRRGLVGQLLSWSVNPEDLTDARVTVTSVYLGLQALLYVGLFGWVWVLERRRRDYVMFAMFAVFLSSQFVPTLAFDVGFLDIFDCLLLLVAAFGLARDRPIWALIAGLAGPFIHESFIIVWLTIAIVALWERVSVGRIAVLASPILSGVILSLAASTSAVSSQLSASAIPGHEATEAVLWHFGQSAVANFEIMMWKFRYNAVNVLLASLICLPPAFIMVVAYGCVRKSWRDFVVIAAATVAPLSILLVAWDLTRFLAWTSFAALVTIAYCESVRPAESLPMRWPALACAAAAAIFVQVPFVYGYFEGAGVADRLSTVREMPIGRVVAATIQFYNRNIGPKVVTAMGDEPPPGEIWYVEEGGWRGGWIRRAGTKRFDAIMTMGRSVTGYTADVERRGDLIIVRRYPDLDPSVRMDYSGTLKDGVINGIFPGGPWRAEIRQ